MVINRRWVQRNLVYPVATPAPASTFSFTRAASASNVEDFQREMIDFDSEAPEGREFLAFTTATGLSRLRTFHGRVRWRPKPGEPPRGIPPVLSPKRMCW